MRRALLASLARSLVLQGKVETTSAKAKAIRPMVEKMITAARGGGLANRRRVSASLGETTSKKLFETIGPGYSDRPGGYTRIIKKSASRGDNAEVVIIELV